MTFNESTQKHNYSLDIPEIIEKISNIENFDGEGRLYINDRSSLIGLDFNHFDNCTLNDEYISESDANTMRGELGRSRIWCDTATGEIVIKNLDMKYHKAVITGIKKRLEN